MWVCTKFHVDSILRTPIGELVNTSTNTVDNPTAHRLLSSREGIERGGGRKSRKGKSGWGADDVRRGQILPLIPRAPQGNRQEIVCVCVWHRLPTPILTSSHHKCAAQITCYHQRVKHLLSSS